MSDPREKQVNTIEAYFLNTCLRDFLPLNFPKIITLCGSTRFKDAYINATRTETLKGHIVISVGLFGHQEGLDMTGDTKQMLDTLHLRKIDLADEVLIVDEDRWWCPICRGWDMQSDSCSGHTLSRMPYIGSSTKNEIAYAESKNKVIRYLSKESNK